MRKPAAKKPVVRKKPSKTSAKKPIKTSTKTTRPKTPARKAPTKTAASVAARKATIAATMLREDPARLVIDDHDDAALIKIKRIKAPSARIKRSATDRIDDPPPATGAKLIERVTRAIERELNQIETIVGGHRVTPTLRTEAERRARTLASLARTLSEVTRLRAQQEPDADDDADAGPRDLDEFRATLARRLECMVAGAADRPAGGDEPD